MRTYNLNLEEIKNKIRYDADTGNFYWLTSNNQVKLDTPAGSIDSRGYLQIKINGNTILAHRLAWLFITGELPKLTIDHINGNKLDNSIKNLRECEISLNNLNKKLYKNSTSGFKGVSFHKKTGKYQASICLYGKTYYLGLFVTAEEAAEAYNKAASELFKDFNRNAQS